MTTSNKTRNRSFRGGGAMYLREIGSVAGLFAVGNADSLQFAINEEKQTQRNFQNPGGGNIASESSITDVTASINVLSINPRIAALALRGLVTTQESASISDESHLGYKDMFIPLDFLPDFSQTLTVTDDGASTTYVANTDYLIRNNGIFITPDSNIVEGDELKITYTSKDSYSIETITKSAVEYEMFFDGFNEADSGKAVSVRCHRIAFSPAQALSLITEDFGALPMDFEVLADGGKDGTTESQYFVVVLEQ